MSTPSQPPVTSGSAFGLNVETASIVGSLGLAVGAAVTQQVLLASLASVSLSVAAGLNLINRNRLIDAAHQAQHQELLQLQQQVEGTQAELGQLANTTAAELAQVTDQMTTDRQLLAQVGEQGDAHASAIAALTNQTQAQQEQLASLDNQLTQTQDQLDQQTQALRQDNQKLAAKEQEIAGIVQELQSIDQLTQAIRLDTDNADLYYQRGMVRVGLNRDEDHWTAIDDFSQAITLNPNHADAHYQRGQLRSQLSDKKLAVGDLRTAAKLYFQQGKLEKYDHAMALSQQQHEQLKANSAAAESDEPPLLEDLFA